MTNFKKPFKPQKTQITLSKENLYRELNDILENIESGHIGNAKTKLLILISEIYNL